MTLRRIALCLTTLLVAPLAVVGSASSAQALGQRTQTWNTGDFKASITVNWTSKHTFAMWGWIADTDCDSRGTYLDRIFVQRKKAGDVYTTGSYWWILAKDANGCDNGRVQIAKRRFDAGKTNVPLLRVPIYSENKSAASDTRLVYSKVWNNPYIDG